MKVVLFGLCANICIGCCRDEHQQPAELNTNPIVFSVKKCNSAIIKQAICESNKAKWKSATCLDETIGYDAILYCVSEAQRSAQASEDKVSVYKQCTDCSTYDDIGIRYIDLNVTYLNAVIKELSNLKLKSRLNKISFSTCFQTDDCKCLFNDKKYSWIYLDDEISNQMILINKPNLINCK